MYTCIHPQYVYTVFGGKKVYPSLQKVKLEADLNWNSLVTQLVQKKVRFTMAP